MRRYLIVANQTLGGEHLERAVRDRVERGDSRFYVLVPMTGTQHETSGWSGGFEGMTPDAVQQAMRQEQRQLSEARNRAESRLTQMLDQIRSTGAEAEGTVGQADPVVAVKEILRDESFDEVIVSTLPTGMSRWLKMDLPSRVSRMTRAPVTTLRAEG